MKFRPLHDRVLIEVLDSEEKTSGGKGCGSRIGC